MSMSITRVGVPALGLAALLLTGCGGVSDLTKERVARSDTVVRQAQQTLGNSEHGALELQNARDHLQKAKRAVEDNKAELADRHAHLATLDAELAVARSQSASARAAADELLASIQTLRDEARRSSESR